MQKQSLKDNPVYKDYVSFRQTFGDDGNVLVVGIQTDQLFNLATFEVYSRLQKQLKKVTDVEDVLALTSAITLQKDTVTGKMGAVKIFDDSLSTQAQLD